MNAISLRGVKTHNLKNLDIQFPYRTLTVVTGVSGSGKSSLAFDTLYAEGQRRYVESLSSYARQFLERMEKPDLEFIEGILPSIAIEAKNIVTNARSTVGTQTEINDYLRLLFARVGKTFCGKCRNLVSVDSPDSISKFLAQSYIGEEAQVLFPVKTGENSGKYLKSALAEYEKQGFLKARINGKTVDIDSVEHTTGPVLVVVDKMEVDSENSSRMTESVETAFRYGKSRVEIVVKNKSLKFSNRFACSTCGIEYKSPTPNLFSFNNPLGACPACQGFGRVITIDWNLVVPDTSKSIAAGAIEPWTKPSAKSEFDQLKTFCKHKKIPLDRPYRDLTDEQRNWILFGDGSQDYFSVQDFFRYLEKKVYKMHVRVFLSKYRAYLPCSECHGTRLKPEALLVKISGLHIASVSKMTIEQSRVFFDRLDLDRQQTTIAEPILLEIKSRLRFLDEVGLGYLTLDRPSRTLSGGEAQRINLATSLGSALVDTLYVLDEPSIGLHERDNHMLIRLLKELRDRGNTVVIVEHDRSMIEAADKIIDLGPFGGEKGGEIVYAGNFQDLKKSNQSLTAKYFKHEFEIDREKIKVNGKHDSWIQLSGAKYHNLKDISFKIPLHSLVVLTGVSGSGKSTLLYDILYANYERFRGRPVSDVGPVRETEGFHLISDMVLIDQSPIGRTPRSNPATYLKVFDDIRTAFAKTKDAKAKKLQAGFFSFNVPGGRCERCEGAGFIKVEMHFLADVFVTCESCQGSRYQSHVLDIRYHGKNIQEVLQLTIEEAVRFFSLEERIVQKLSILVDMGLGYLRLGQSATTLSSGEAQRLKLASEMSQNGVSNLLYLFDEPTTGLHYHDVELLLSAFDKILKKGHSICVIEHNMEVIKCADYVIDLGPEGGEKGGEIVYSGTVEGLVKSETSHTGKFLKKYLG